MKKKKTLSTFLTAFFTFHPQPNLVTTCLHGALILSSLALIDPPSFEMYFETEHYNNGSQRWNHSQL